MSKNKSRLIAGILFGEKAPPAGHEFYGNQWSGGGGGGGGNYTHSRTTQNNAKAYLKKNGPKFNPKKLDNETVDLSLSVMRDNNLDSTQYEEIRKAGQDALDFVRP